MLMRFVNVLTMNPDFAEVFDDESIGATAPTGISRAEIEGLFADLLVGMPQLR